MKFVNFKNFIRLLHVPLLLVCSLPFLMMYCPKPYKYNEGTLPESPVNMVDFNTSYDDYNMSAPTFGADIPILFSTNRSSHGEQFDVIYHLFEISFDRRDGTLDAGRQVDYHYDVVSEHAILETVPSTINTSANELGPYLIDFFNLFSDYSNNYYRRYLCLYASDSSGNRDIYFTHNYHPGNDTNLIFIDPRPVNFLNSNNNDAYPCIDLSLNRIYFTSDALGNLDIYYCELPASMDILDVLEDTITTYEITLSTALSSEGQDNCPYIYKDIIVFTSNRQGGFGGWDLWYAERDNLQWSTPVNFGEKINTAYDEYRPVLHFMPEFKQDLLFFSSNRPGGKGGYDLYFVGVKKFEPGLY